MTEATTNCLLAVALSKLFLGPDAEAATKKVSNGVGKPLKEVPSIDEGEEVFFDYRDNLLSEGSVVVKEDLFNANSGYNIWLKEPLECEAEQEEIYGVNQVYVRKEIRAHEGLIWFMKFSPNDQDLASGGQDGLVHIWHVTQADVSCKERLVILPAAVNFHIRVLGCQSYPCRARPPRSKSCSRARVGWDFASASPELKLAMQYYFCNVSQFGGIAPVEDNDPLTTSPDFLRILDVKERRELSTKNGLCRIDLFT
ncbi:hypothetical protein Acr_18g0004530 [Actinidia rufa]|uniref:Transducin/WD40 repeat-like superfamily protein n=1 Tax=Actinidia rufa TaxID=165716 RepID=A0A7J0G665_9ERIC|nr:hypothetical protein Acr_18g0004530 [Actinidia rufa]